MPEVWLESRLQSLTPRERQVLLLWVEPKSTVQDAADALGTTPGTVSSVRQSIRRKLAVPRGSDVVDFLRANEADLSAVFDTPAQEPVVERRRLHVLRSAIRDLDVTARRASTRAAALQRLAEHSDDDERRPLLAEAAVVEALAHDVIELRDRMLIEAKAAAWIA